VHLSFTSLAIVAAIAFAAPLALGLAPAPRLPSVVLEIGLGIIVGPSALGWVHVDSPVEVISLLGLAFLLLDGILKYCLLETVRLALEANLR